MIRKYVDMFCMMPKFRGLSLHKLMKKYDNFVFDLYGTLIDIHTDEYADETWKKFVSYLDSQNVKHPTIEVLREDFFSLDKTYRQRCTQYEYPEIDILDVYEELLIRYGNQVQRGVSNKRDENIIGEDQLERLSYAFRESSREYMQLFTGVEEFFRCLKTNDKKIFLLSNAQASYTEPEIKSLGLDKWFDDIRISSKEGCMKPDRSFYDVLIERNCLDRRKTVMFGDSYENDYLGAKEADIAGVWLNGKIGTDSECFYRKCMEASI